MVSSKEESFSEETNSANSEYAASWQQDSDEEDLTPLSSEGSSRSTYKRKRASSLPEIHKMKLAPTYPNVPVVNSSSLQNPWPWMCPPWMQNPWMYAQPMPMPPPWTMGAQPAVMSYNAPWMQVSPSSPWTMGAQPAVMAYNNPWMQVSPTQWANLKDYGGNGSQMKKAEKRVKTRKHVKNVSNVGRKAKVRKVVKLKKKRGNHLSLTEKPDRLQASQGNGQKKSRLVGSFAARMSAIEDRQNEIEGMLCKLLANTIAVTEALHEFQSKLVEYVINYKDIKLVEYVVNCKDNKDDNPMQKGRN